MRRNRLRLPRPLQHEQLRQHRDALQPDRKTPQDLGEGVFLREEEGEHGGAAEQVEDLEGVEVRVVRGLVVVQHQVDGVGGGGDEDDLEDRVPGRVGEGPEEVWVGVVSGWRGKEDGIGDGGGWAGRTEVAGDVDEEVEGLGLE